MENSVIEVNHTFSLSHHWRAAFVEKLGARILADKRIMLFEQAAAKGETYFMEVAPGIFALLIDAEVQIPIRFTRMPSEDDFWIIYYDLSDNLNKHTVNKVHYDIGDNSKYGLGVIDSAIHSSYHTKVGSHIYSLRIFIEKNAMKDILKNVDLKEEFKDVFNKKKKKIFFYRYIDSRSKVVLYKLKQQAIQDLNFEFAVKSTVFNLLGYFLERVSARLPVKQAYEKDVEAVEKSQEFLLTNLYLSFPGNEELAQIAHMSPSKYNKIYKGIYGSSPALFFKNQKLKLANELLASGKYRYISEVVFELGYSKTTYFTMIYKKHFGFLPSRVFKKLED
ncbi:helix-turn-helix domain-containing protein [Flavobacterium sp. JP2137]|uniref:helix-turn-helix domain-containing protein n=1 Tax=Flavobacterium sp. JP2137 TaxID=3414510 RepID=UPI003D2FC220